MVRATVMHSTSDVDLITRIGIAFATRPRITWNNIHVAAQNGAVTLRGEVPTAYDRHLIVAVTRHVAGVRLIDDDIKVAEDSARKAELAKESAATPSPRTVDEKTAETIRHHLNQLPVLSESLEDILATRATDAHHGS